MNTPYEFKFGTDETDVVLCERELTEEDIVSDFNSMLQRRTRP